MATESPRYLVDYETGEIQESTDENLLLKYEHVLAQLELYDRERFYYEREIRRRIEKQGSTATMLLSDEFECKLQVRRTYSQEAFTPLKEILPGIDLARVLEPAHTKTVEVPDKWDTRRLLPMLQRMGDRGLQIRVAAEQDEKVTLVFKRR